MEFILQNHGTRARAACVSVMALCLASLVFVGTPGCGCSTSYGTTPDALQEFCSCTYEWKVPCNLAATGPETIEVTIIGQTGVVNDAFLDPIANGDPDVAIVPDSDPLKGTWTISAAGENWVRFEVALNCDYARNGGEPSLEISGTTPGGGYCNGITAVTDECWRIRLTYDPDATTCHPDPLVCPPPVMRILAGRPKFESVSILDGEILCPSACCCPVDVWWESNGTDYPTSFFGNDVLIRIRDLPADDSLHATVPQPNLIPISVAVSPQPGESGVNYISVCVDPGHIVSTGPPAPAILVLEAVADSGNGPVIATAEFAYTSTCRLELTDTSKGDYETSGWPVDFTWNWQVDYQYCTR